MAYHCHVHEKAEFGYTTYGVWTFWEFVNLRIYLDKPLQTHIDRAPINRRPLLPSAPLASLPYLPPSTLPLPKLIGPAKPVHKRGGMHLICFLMAIRAPLALPRFECWRIYVCTFQRPQRCPKLGTNINLLGRLSTLSLPKLPRF